LTTRGRSAAETSETSAIKASMRASTERADKSFAATSRFSIGTGS
jgi:hypothetical protein